MNSSMYCSGHVLRYCNVYKRASMVSIWWFRHVSSRPGPTQESAWRKAVNTIKTFGQGAKLLIRDIRKMLRIRREMDGFKLTGATPMTTPSNSIKLEDVRFIYKTSADLKRTFPTLVLFCIPLLGYIAPFLALLFPEQLLSSHFWSEQQKQDLVKKSLQRRREGVTKLSQVALNGKDPLSLAVREIQNKGCTHEGFSKDVNNISQLPTQHLEALFQSWGVSRSLVPLGWFQYRNLRRHLHYIHTCDWIMHRNGSAKGFDDILKAELVRERLPLYDGPPDDYDAVLKKWMNSKQDTLNKDNSKSVNEVYLLHMILLDSSVTQSS